MTPGRTFVSDRLAPVAPRLKAWGEAAIITDWLQLREAPGHTPGTALAFVEAQGSSAALVGDLAHHPLEIANPDWAFIGDTDSNAASRQRMRWFAQFAVDSMPIFAAHFPDAAPIRIEQRNGSLHVVD